MKFNLSKIKLPSFDFKSLFSFSPRDLWNGFLWFLILAIILVIIFDVWIYFHFLSGADGGDGETNTLKTRSLDKALERMEIKRNNTEIYKSGFVIEDPS
jgi:hypothetical protein